MRRGSFAKAESTFTDGGFAMLIKKKRRRKLAPQSLWNVTDVKT
jgi:hypothetical protein